MKIDFDGRMWEFDVEDIPVGQCEAVEKFCPAKGMGDFYNQLDAGRTKAVIALWWLIRKAGGEAPGPISQPGEDFRPLRLLAAFNRALQAEVDARKETEAEQGDGEEDPTPAGSLPGSSPGRMRGRGGGVTGRRPRGSAGSWTGPSRRSAPSTCSTSPGCATARRPWWTACGCWTSRDLLTVSTRY